MISHDQMWYCSWYRMDRCRIVHDIAWTDVVLFMISHDQMWYYSWYRMSRCGIVLDIACSDVTRCKISYLQMWSGTRYHIFKRVILCMISHLQMWHCAWYHMFIIFWSLVPENALLCHKLRLALTTIPKLSHIVTFCHWMSRDDFLTDSLYVVGHKHQRCGLDPRPSPYVSFVLPLYLLRPRTHSAYEPGSKTALKDNY